MSDAFFHRSHLVHRPERARSARRLPIGYGLAIGAAASIGLWGGIIWMAVRLLG